MTFQQELWLDAQDHAKRLSLFVTALVPAWVILLTRYAFSADANPLTCLLLALPVAVVPAIVIWCLRRAALASSDFVPIRVKKKFDISSDVALYALTYIPFVLIDELTLVNLIVFIILIIVVYTMYAKFNLLHINPLISMFYRPYRVVDDHGNTVVVFSKLKVRARTDLPCIEISENLYIVATGDR